jgi:hypothetical protein
MVQRASCESFGLDCKNLINCCRANTWSCDGVLIRSSRIMVTAPGSTARVLLLKTLGDGSAELAPAADGVPGAVGVAAAEGSPSGSANSRKERTS